MILRVLVVVRWSSDSRTDAERAERQRRDTDELHVDLESCTDGG